MKPIKPIAAPNMKRTPITPEVIGAGHTAEGTMLRRHVKHSGKNFATFKEGGTDAVRKACQHLSLSKKKIEMMEGKTLIFDTTPSDQFETVIVAISEVVDGEFYIDKSAVTDPHEQPVQSSPSQL
jgi:hypothetical protein